MDFGMTITALKRGHCVARKGWNDKERYIKLNADNEAIIEASGFEWPALPANMLAEDWYIVKY